ncbi:hypothetical protein [Desulfosediminicola flagellatus]|uniref:hypothetical protein n=1 Tax=Desulfosediminicola flagellatus TaxID=2569541 RepID=UPI0010AC2F19|nr:hypothetical protein [Desulfosediminicola flagellatus]
MGNDITGRKKDCVVPGHKYIWDIPEKFHVTILAVCLSENELTRLGVISGGRNAMNSCKLESLMLSAEGVHVHSAKSENIQQVLDAKFKLSLLRFGSAASTHDLEKLWQASMIAGEFRGAYWAVMTHHRTSLKMQESISQQVSVFSILNCCMHQQQKRKSCDLQRKMNVMGATLLEHQRQYRTTVCR